MIRLLRALFATPEAERDPAAWATRLFAHIGVGLIGWAFFLPALGPWGAVLSVSILYTIWEAGQWPGSPRMLWDALLDWSVVILSLLLVASAWERNGTATALSGAAILIICAVGVVKRRPLP